MPSTSLDSKFYTTSKDTRTHYLETSNRTGTLIVCLHGLGGSTNTFNTLVDRLPETYRVVLVDFQGFGKSPLTSTSQPLSIQGHVADIHDLVTHIQADSNSVAEGQKVVFISHSLGSIVALHYAAQYPSSVAGLALLGVGRSAAHIAPVRQRMLDVAAATRKLGIERTAENSAKGNFPAPEQRATPPEHFEEVRTAVAASDPEGYAKTCEMIVDSSHVDPDYGKITCSAVFVAGDMDVISPVQRSEDVNKLVGGESWVQVVKSGHQPLISDFDATVSAISQLLQNV